MDAPAWLVAHARGERVLWAHEPDRRWMPLAWALLGIGISVYFAGPWFMAIPGRWSWVGAVLPAGATPTVPGWIGIAAGGLGFAWTLVQAHIKRHFTAWAITDARLVRVTMLGPSRAESWPLAQVRVVEREKDRRRERTRVEVRAPTGKRVARFRVTTSLGGGFADALAAHLTGTRSTAAASSW